MAESIRPLASGFRTGRATLKARLALAASALLLGACLQTEPGVPPEGTLVIPEDNGRMAGASSSTNWPTDGGQPRTKVTGKADPDLRLNFTFVDLLSPELLPVEVKGMLRFYRAGTIPALESQTPEEMTFGPTDTLVIPNSYLDSLWPSTEDTLRFNIEIQSDSGVLWLMGFKHYRKQGKTDIPLLSTKSGEPFFLRPQNRYFTGNLKVDTTVLTPSSGNSEFCFYIPGTPIFGKVQADAQFKIGPLPKGEYPLRLLRLTQAGDKPGETLVEAWEAPVDQIIFDSSMTPGAKVLSVRTQGKLTLRNAE